jgi:lysophospholipase L1-like esterase
VDSGAEQRVDGASGKAGPAGSPIRRLRLETPVKATLTVVHGRGSPELFGAVVESQAPGGVVVDTLGINGGRAATALAWQESAFVAEVGARAPALLVLAYGTNEAASSLAPERYERQLGELLARLRRAAPKADCLLLGPPDMADAEGRTLPRVLEFDRVTESAAAANGCAFFSLLSAMGGEGSMARWVAESPPLAIKDHIHLTARGYERVGGALASELLAAYDRHAPED